MRESGAAPEAPTVSTFQWPPRRASDAAILPVNGDTAPIPPIRKSASAAPEVLQNADSRPTQAPPAASLSREHAGASILRDIEHTWLDLLVPPLPDRLRLLGWEPEPRLAYCHRCGQSVGPHEAADDGCRHCRGQRRPWSNLIRVSEYSPPFSDIVHEIKFSKWRRLARDAGRLLGTIIASELQMGGPALDPYRKKLPLVIPMPMSFRRRMLRGIDHSAAIVRGVRQTLPCEVVRALGRRHRPSQLAVAPHRRATNVAGTMWLRIDPARLTGRLVIIVDDVTTTGATLRAACRAIHEGLKKPKRIANSGSFHAKSLENPGNRGCIWAAVLTVTRAEEAVEGQGNLP
ncbi:MAG: hypothetical protein AB7O77_01415 [Phycisphaerales bacterium]